MRNMCSERARKKQETRIGIIMQMGDVVCALFESEIPSSLETPDVFTLWNRLVKWIPDNRGEM
jgi:hypothetical protein